MARTLHFAAILLPWVLLLGCEDLEPAAEEAPATSRDEEEPEAEVDVAKRVEPRAPGGEAIEYTLRFPRAANHYAEVQAVVPTDGQDPLEVFLPVWTPGSYLVREYARHLEELEVTTPDGRALEVDKFRKNRWRIATEGVQRVVLRYRVYGREMTVRTNFIDDSLAVIVGAATFIAPVEGMDRSYDVAIEPHEGWEDVATGLDRHPEAEGHRYLAVDYDELVDSPIVLGNAERYEAEFEGIPHELANFGEAGLWDGAQSWKDVKAIVEEQLEFWQVVPYERYVFLNVLTEGARGGLEHLDSTLMMADPWAYRQREDYLGWLGLVSHEFFHTWSGKRLRPEPLGPFDYENEVYTRTLWIVEGITSYYDDLMLERAGLLERKEYLSRLGEQIESVQTTPGRKVQSLEMASYDAWIKYYRWDENSPNTAISYYRKGAVVAWLLDAEIRRATGGGKSLDDVMRLAYERYSGESGYTPEAFRSLASEVAGTDLEPFFARAVESTQELDYGPALDWFGLRFAPTDEEEGEETEEPAGWLGADIEVRGGRLVVTGVPRETPAYEAGLNVEDEILAIGDRRVPPQGLEDRLARHRPGSEIEMLVARRGLLRRVPVVLGEKPEDAWKLEVVPRPTGAQQARLEQWLGSPPLEVRREGGE